MITEGPRYNDLSHALHTVEVEIDRYETAMQLSSERRLGLASELTKLRGYRDEILSKLSR